MIHNWMKLASRLYRELSGRKARSLFECPYEMTLIKKSAGICDLGQGFIREVH